MIQYLCVTFFGLFFSSSIYDISIEKSDGTNLTLNQFRGTKIMIVILPSAQTAEGTVFLHQLDSITKANNNYSFIAVPSYEEGYTDSAAAFTQQWYHSIVDTKVVITNGMFTHKLSAIQHPLFGWLTNINLNNHFDEDVYGEGSKFFINESGELVGELWNNISFDSPVMQRVFKK